MVEFNRLNDTSFPDLDTVDTYQYKVNFDFSKFKNPQMRIRVLNVPWDLGSVHVGNKIVTGIGNVVYFESKNERDSWFNQKRYAHSSEEWMQGEYDGFEWITDYRHYHSEDKMFLPLPFDVLAKFNYVTIDYYDTPTSDSPIDYEGNGIVQWYYFIRNIKMNASSTSEAEIYGDLWTTYIYDMHIPYMTMEQGHVFVANTDATDFLVNPIENNKYLLAEDASYGDLQKVTSTESVVLNAEHMLAVIVTDSQPMGIWGSPGDNWSVPSPESFTRYGVPSFYAIGVEPETLDALLEWLDTNIPQFKQTVKGVFFVSQDLISTYGPYQFGDFEYYIVENAHSQLPLMNALDVDLFGYDEKYAHLAKLYTYPYAAIEIVDDSGNSTLVKVEDTTGTLELDVAANVAFPYISLDTHLIGIGGNGRNSLTFRDVNEHTFSFSGRWYQHVKKWDVPIFAITQNAAIDYGFKHFYDIAQKRLDAEVERTIAKRDALTTYNNTLASNLTNYNNTLASNLTNYNNTTATNATNADNSYASAATAFDNASASIDTAKANSDRSALANYDNALASNLTANQNALDTNSTAQTNANADADTVVSNATSQIACNANITDANNTALSENGLIATEESTANTGESNAVIEATTNNQILADQQSAAISAASGAISGAVNGASGGAIGIITGLISGATSAVTSMAQMQVGVNLTESQAEVNKQSNINRNFYANRANGYGGQSRGRVSVQMDNNNTVKFHTNANLEVQTNNNAALTRANATRTKTMADTNANRAKTTGDANALRTKTAANDNATLVETTDDANASRNKTTTDANIGRTKTTADANALASKTTGDSNALASKTTADANALASRDTAYADADDRYSLAMSRINADIDSAALNGPIQYGEFTHGETALTRPMGLFANVVTQSDDAIARAGDEFLRYGYRYTGNWTFDGDFNVMPRFSFWKCSDVWIEGLNMPDEHVDYIRFLLIGGVTIWRRPEYIGHTSIYDNV